MATTFADLEARVRGLESRAQRYEEDVTAIITTVMETRENVAVLKSDVGTLKEDVAVLKEDAAALKSVLKDDVGALKGDVRWLKRGMQALLDQQGLAVDPDDQ